MLIKKRHVLYGCLVLGACSALFGCSGPDMQPLDVVLTPPPITTPPPQPNPPMPDPPTPDPPNEDSTTIPSDIIETKTALEHTVYEHDWEAIADNTVQQQIDDTIQWVKDNCARSFQTGTPPDVGMLFTTRDARTDYIEYLNSRLAHWLISDNRIHDVNGTYYYLLEFTVNRVDSTVYKNCIDLFD